jgi:uncharacterized protein HemX
MPDNETETKEASSTEMTDAQKAAVQKAKGSTSKKVVWWILGVLGIIIVIITLIVIFLPKKDEKNAVDRIIAKTKHETDKADVEAKVKVAKAEGVAEEKIEEIKKTLEIEDTNERRARLAELL